MGAKGRPLNFVRLTSARRAAPSVSLQSVSVCVGHGAATATAAAAEGAHYLALVGRGQNRPVEPIFDEAIAFLPSALGLVTNCRWAWVVSCSWTTLIKIGEVAPKNEDALHA